MLSNELTKVRTLQKYITAWKNVCTETIIHCFQKCGFEKGSDNSIDEENDIDEEFQNLLTQHCENNKITVKDFITFDDDLTTSINRINTNLVDWRQQARYEAIQEVLPAFSGDSPTANEVVSDDDE